ncbi:hypothetical protein MRB53_039607 [Persea americana]|nr:hypothetical protein MRB53_039607 [Persea americana]
MYGLTKVLLVQNRGIPSIWCSYGLCNDSASHQKVHREAREGNKTLRQDMQVMVKRPIKFGAIPDMIKDSRKSDRKQDDTQKMS